MLVDNDIFIVEPTLNVDNSKSTFSEFTFVFVISIVVVVTLSNVPPVLYISFAFKAEL